MALGELGHKAPYGWSRMGEGQVGLGLIGFGLRKMGLAVLGLSRAGDTFKIWDHVGLGRLRTGAMLTKGRR